MPRLRHRTEACARAVHGGSRGAGGEAIDGAGAWEGPSGGAGLLVRPHAKLHPRITEAGTSKLHQVYKM